MKSHLSNFYLESRTLISNTGVTDGISEDTLCFMNSYLTVPYRTEAPVIIKTRHELKIDVETTPETLFGLIIS
jgi:hypothetical protein